MYPAHIHVFCLFFFSGLATQIGVRNSQKTPAYRAKIHVKAILKEMVSKPPEEEDATRCQMGFQKRSVGGLKICIANAPNDFSNFFLFFLVLFFAGVPGEVVYRGFLFPWTQLFSSIVAILVVTNLFLPIFYKMRLTSVYEVILTYLSYIGSIKNFLYF